MALRDAIVVLASLFAVVMSHSCPNTPAPDGVDYPLVLSIPTGCERSQCSFYVAIRVSDEDQEFLDFKMQGRASGYIAIGFGKQKSRMVG
ncbi:hypothetical protein EMCRGX_G002931 [Ephydatia muelleri]